MNSTASATAQWSRATSSARPHLDGGFNPLNRRYAPDTPEYARGQRLQNLGSAITLGVKGQF